MALLAHLPHSHRFNRRFVRNLTVINTNLQVRKAGISDSAACSAVLCSSIRELCTADHNGNEQIIDCWLDNKTPETLRNWIQNSESIIYVAEVEGHVVAVGGVRGSEIALNYVLPCYRGLGVSTAMLRELESVLLDLGFRNIQLTSTATAHDFYRKAGWVDSGEPVESFGILGFPMKKTI